MKLRNKRKSYAAGDNLRNEPKKPLWAPKYERRDSHGEFLANEKLIA